MATQNIPSFFIVGVQKAGTTTLASILNNVDGITISTPKEPMFFCYDDYAAHRDEILDCNTMKFKAIWENDKEKLLNEYLDIFKSHSTTDIFGEASTTYANSIVAASRIKKTFPKSKIIFILRDPILRAYSAYWHCIYSGITCRSFEDELKLGGINLVEYGCYYKQIKNYQELFGKDNVLVVHLENLIANPLKTITSVVSFLEIDAELPRKILEIHDNKTNYPMSISIHSKLIKSLAIFSKPSSYNLKTTSSQKKGSILRLIYKKTLLSRHKPKPLNENTKNCLKKFYEYENRRLIELINEDAFTIWGWN